MVKDVDSSDWFVVVSDAMYIESDNENLEPTHFVLKLDKTDIQLINELIKKL
jgi:hypothetical protein